MTIAVGLLARISIVTATLLAVSGCGTSRPAVVPSRGGSTLRLSVDHTTVALHVSSRIPLPTAVQLPALAVDAGGVLALGGLNASDESTANVVLIEQGHARRVGNLPQALHDAAAAGINGQAYFFGGGASTASSAILRVTQTGLSTLAGRLPLGASDVEAATIANTAYVVGGYAETEPLRTIVAFTPGRGARVVAQMPRPLRYAAVAAVGDRLLIAGGTSGIIPQRAILSFDPASGAVRQIGLLPVAITHAAGASLGGHFYVLGGRAADLSSQRRSIFAIDPTSGIVQKAGDLPRALSDLGAASLPGHILLVGGREAAGTVSDQALILETGDERY
jgi:hypothetical protein